MSRKNNKQQLVKSIPQVWALSTAVITFCCCIFIGLSSYKQLAREELQNIQRAVSHIAINNPQDWTKHPQTLSLLLSENTNIHRYIELNSGELIPNSGITTTSGIHSTLPIYTPEGEIGKVHSFYDYNLLTSNLILILICCSIFGALTYIFLTRCCRELEKDISKAEFKKNQAEAANLAKNSFLAHISHELRTPINGITSINDLLLRTELTPRQSELINMIKGSGRILLSVANDLLDITRIENKELTLENRQINLERIIEDIGILMSADANERGLQLFINYSPDLPAMYIADASRLRQIIMNLVGNAIKFTHLGHVYLTAEPAPESLDPSKVTVRIKVEDTGVGLDPVEKQTLLNSLENMPHLADRGRDGHAGLGLTIVNQITQLMNGKISIETAVGKGSTFMVDIPLEQDVEHAKAQKTSPFKNMRVLLIDDHALHRDIILQHLQAWGVEVTFTTEERAVDKMKEAQQNGHPFDVTLFHESIQEASGMRFARIIRSEPTLKEAKIILLADRKQLYLSNEHNHKGFSVLIGKPVRPSELYDALFSMSNDTATLHSNIKLGAKQSEKLHKKITALLVEDNHLSQQVAKLNLELLGCDVDVAANGEKALHLVRKKDYDIIFMDCHMPVMNGFETTERIRKLEKEGYVRSTPIIAITAEALIGDKEKCFKSGMDAYISKPYVQQDLREAIEHWAIHSERRAETQKTTEEAKSEEPAPDPATGNPVNGLDANPTNS